MPAPAAVPKRTGTVMRAESSVAPGLAASPRKRSDYLSRLVEVLRAAAAALVIARAINILA